VNCNAGGTVVNTVTHLQQEFAPESIGQHIQFEALLGSMANVTITVGGVSYDAPWKKVPYGNVGVYHGRIALRTDATGPVLINLYRSGVLLRTLTGRSVGGCMIGDGNYANFNAETAGSTLGKAISATTPGLWSDLVCTEGNGVSKGSFSELCPFVCSLGYCPLGGM
jgi:hypothetical protein